MSQSITFENKTWEVYPRGQGYMLLLAGRHHDSIASKKYFDDLNKKLTQTGMGKVVGWRQIFITAETMTWIRISAPSSQ